MTMTGGQRDLHGLMMSSHLTEAHYNLHSVKFQGQGPFQSCSLLHPQSQAWHIIYAQ